MNLKYLYKNNYVFIFFEFFGFNMNYSYEEFYIKCLSLSYKNFTFLYLQSKNNYRFSRF